MKKCVSIAIIIYTAFIFQGNAHPGKLFNYQKTTPLSLASPIHLFWTHYTFESHFFSTKSKNVLSYQDKERITDTFITKAQLNAKYDFPGEDYLCEQDSQDLKTQMIEGNLQLKSLNQRKFIKHHLQELCNSIYWIKTLKLNDLNIKNLPSNFNNLQQLKELYLSNNNLEKLPKDIGDLKSLKILYLNDNNIEYLPKSIGNLSELKIINLNRNKNLRIIPRSFLKLTKLEQILLNSTNLKEKIGTKEYEGYIENERENGEQTSYAFIKNVFENLHIHYDDLEEHFEKSPIWDNCFYAKKE